MKFFAPPAYSFAGKPGEPVLGVSPGPGAYEVREDLGLLPAPKFSPLQERTSDSSQPPSIGPGSYDIPSIFTIDRNRAQHKLVTDKIKEGNRLKSLKDRVGKGSSLDLPGPGTYSPFVKEFSPAPSMGNRTYAFRKEKEDVPGPGAYSPDKPTKRLGVSMKTSLRSTLTDAGNCSPGPAAYNTRSKADSPMVRFGTESKLTLSASSKGIPGPGSYSPPSLFSKYGGAVSITGKEPPRKKEVLPGPAEYSPKPVYSTLAPVFGTGGRSYNSPRSDAPGPGEYDPVNPVHATTHKATLKMSPRKGMEGGRDQSPGPTAYTLHSTFDDSRKVSFSGRRHDYSPAQTIPGPAAYDLHYSAVEGHSPKAALGSGKRTDIVLQSASPGPIYSTRLPPDPPYWKIHKEGLKVRRPPDDVGPGTYTLPPCVPDSPHYQSKH